MTTTEVRMAGRREWIGPGVIMLRDVGSGAARRATTDPVPDRDTAREHAFPQSAAACVPAPEA
jgi:hypothetical protein